MSAVEHPDKAVERFIHDAEGRHMEHVDSLGGKTLYEYGRSGRLLGQTDAAGRQLRYRWDEMDRLWQLTNENGEVTEFLYDPVGRLLQERRKAPNAPWPAPMMRRLDG